MTDLLKGNPSLPGYIMLKGNGIACGFGTDLKGKFSLHKTANIKHSRVAFSLVTGHLDLIQLIDPVVICLVASGVPEADIAFPFCTGKTYIS